MSFVIGILAIVIATFSTGIDSKCFQLRKGDKPAEEDDVPYGYGLFHFVFATRAIGFWGLHQSRNGHELARVIGMSTEGWSLRTWQGPCPHWHMKEWTFSRSVFLS
ncbi:hypothetical protein TSUD_140780 [Trifolium subterraneum]|uniref:Amino acid transporter transmembrane domain-containing protein n=1 Tax=Trifolium subterraneum TaxID=3900 RepID=A0A2Z6PD91_TRISU|nr:hypothetical protein TSUD_140780 [Trifolium subterraneum]